MLTAPARAQDGDLPAAPGQRPELREKLERWRRLSPEERKRLKELYEQHFAGKPKAERARALRDLRQRARDADRRRRDADPERARAKKRLAKQSQTRREGYQRLVRHVLRELPPPERRELALLPPGERRARVRELIDAHRGRVLEKHLRRLPEQEQTTARDALEGLEGRERYLRLRRHVERFVQQRARRLLADPALSDDERRAALEALVRRHVPAERRERVLERLLAVPRRQQRPREGERDRPERDRSGDRDRDRPGDRDRDRPPEREPRPRSRRDGR